MNDFLAPTQDIRLIAFFKTAHAHVGQRPGAVVFVGVGVLQSIRTGSVEAEILFRGLAVIIVFGSMGIDPEHMLRLTVQIVIRVGVILSVRLGRHLALGVVGVGLQSLATNIFYPYHTVLIILVMVEHLPLGIRFLYSVRLLCGVVRQFLGIGLTGSIFVYTKRVNKLLTLFVLLVLYFLIIFP